MASVSSEHAPRSYGRESLHMHVRLFDSIPFGAQLRGAIERAYALFADGSDSSLVRRLAGAAFLIRVVSAALTFVSQIVLAR